MPDPSRSLGKIDTPPASQRTRPIHAGGPVQPQRGFLLHSPDWGGEESIQVGDRWTLTATLDILRAIAEGRGPTRWVAALGYAGWQSGQLEDELRGNGWFATPGSDELLYDCDVDNRWSAAFRSAGVDTRMLTADFGTAFATDAGSEALWVRGNRPHVNTQ